MTDHAFDHACLTAARDHAERQCAELRQRVIALERERDAARADAAALLASIREYAAHHRHAGDNVRSPALVAHNRLMDIAEYPGSRGAALLTELAAARKVVEAVLETDDGPCEYDHHGLCQRHALQPKGACYVELAHAARREAPDA